VKLGELRPCDACGGPLCANLTFLEVRLQLRALRVEKARRFAGMAAYFGGGRRGEALAGHFVDDDDAAPDVGDPDVLLLCPGCWPTALQELAAERRRAAALREQLEGARRCAARPDMPCGYEDALGTPPGDLKPDAGGD